MPKSEFRSISHQFATTAGILYKIMISCADELNFNGRLSNPKRMTPQPECDGIYTGINERILNNNGDNIFKILKTNKRMSLVC
jgi:hypothetical protein